ncbi:MAG: stage II sporulation protein M [Bacteroidetes bacterium]|nr:MAG: stage II sporulation protein M [Bacteroidota bacterium]
MGKSFSIRWEKCKFGHLPMKEAKFLKTRSAKWKEAEARLKERKAYSPDYWANAYIELSDDLSYSQTFYPNSNTTAYLNQLLRQVHRQLYNAERFSWGRVVHFWKEDVPELLLHRSKPILLSFLIFGICFLIGWISVWIDPDFSRLIMGDDYVDRTDVYIDTGNPMGIYGSMNPLYMFFMITSNNIWVSIMVFAFGILTSIGVGVFLANNGIMLGAFTGYFYFQDLGQISSQAIWMHGTFEIFAIVMAGGAGIIMGNGWLFPGSLPRIQSFRLAAAQGGKLMLALIPVFVIAGFIESYFTRHYKNEVLSYATIAVSLLVIIGYFLVYPLYLKRKNGRTTN